LKGNRTPPKAVAHEVKKVLRCMIKVQDLNLPNDLKRVKSFTVFLLLELMVARSCMLIH
jgi:hypothetical protein